MKKVNEQKNQIPNAVAAKENFLLIPVEALVADESVNPRIDYGNIEELMNSILENGIRNPLKGYRKGDKIILKDGHRRMRAISLALEKGHKLERVPVIIEQQALNAEERTLEFLIYNDGKQLTMLEQSEVIKRLLNFGWKITEVVKRTGKARGYIDNLLLLTKAPMKVINYIKEGRISANAVVQIMQAFKNDSEAILAAVEEALLAALEAGKDKATPKHLKKKAKDEQEEPRQSFGKFYKWSVEIADAISGRKENNKEREHILTHLLVCFENGQTPSQVVDAFFTDKTKIKNSKVEVEQKATSEAKAVEKDVTKKVVIKKTAAKKTAAKKGVISTKPSVKKTLR
jgi:ParB/RepB/Spo0J family partition protein